MSDDKADVRAAAAERAAIIKLLRESIPKIRTIDCLMNVQKVDRLRVVRDYIHRIIADIEKTPLAALTPEVPRG